MRPYAHVVVVVRLFVRDVEIDEEDIDVRPRPFPTKTRIGSVVICHVDAADVAGPAIDAEFGISVE